MVITVSHNLSLLSSLNIDYYSTLNRIKVGLIFLGYLESPLQVYSLRGQKSF